MAPKSKSFVWKHEYEAKDVQSLGAIYAKTSALSSLIGVRVALLYMSE